MNNTILIFTDWYSPAYKAGGPIKSINAIVHYLRRDYQFFIVTGDRDLMDQYAHEGVEFDRWITGLYDEKIYYCSQQKLNVSNLRRLISEVNPSVIYLNSVFSWSFAILPQYVWLRFFPAVKLIIAPRGMLGDGALRIKFLKKKCYLLFTRLINFYSRVIWHASSESEKQEVIKHFGNQSKVKVALNLSLPPRAQHLTKIKERGKLNLFFLSRITPKKNLLEAIEYLQAIGPQYTLSFTIIGPTEDNDYLQVCNDAIQKLPSNISVQFVGAKRSDEIESLLCGQHVLLLPTRHENFGHVILESLAHGCPVIISDRTPWNDLVQNKCGFDIPLEHPAKFIEAICFFANMSDQEFEVWSDKSQSYALNHYNNPVLIENMANLFGT